MQFGIRRKLSNTYRSGSFVRLNFGHLGLFIIMKKKQFKCSLTSNSNLSDKRKKYFFFYSLFRFFSLC
ncbi:hypothetical protein RclHR1_00910015 [Rhizophagus clarus]|uniref:Uncharacterized protein n=1 Tax=Rhizophagus clarus TaxID=94130 RepID=A0A2Z6SDQ6_9GLOM|nr:hypothetical protein RclHR1_00910015 [Rhizophagus clarus]